MTRPDIDFSGDGFRPRSEQGDGFLRAVFALIDDTDGDLTQVQMLDIVARAELAGLIVRRNEN